jgi:hypothetical protein
MARVACVVWAVAGIAIACAACGAATEPLIGVEAVNVPACTQAAASVSDASPRCVGAAALVTCSRDEVCISNDPSSCNGISTGCHDLCSTDGEYAVACDDRAPPVPQPPAGCQAVRVAPNGTHYYCCPCSA